MEKAGSAALRGGGLDHLLGRNAESVDRQRRHQACLHPILGLSDELVLDRVPRLGASASCQLSAKWSLQKAHELENDCHSDGATSAREFGKR